MNDNTDNTLQQYVDEYLSPCARFNYGREIVCYPRTRHMPVVQSFGGHQPNLQAHNWRAFRTNVDRHLFDDGHQHYWTVVKYPEYVFLGFYSGDIDFHHKPNETPEEFQRVEDKGWKQVRDVLALGLPIWWTTTPGQEYNGQILYGLNFNLSFSEKISRPNLIDMENRLHAALGWTGAESTTAIQSGGYTRNYRPPPQFNVNMCIVDPDLEIIQPISDGLHEFLEIWKDRPVISTELFDEIVNDDSDSGSVSVLPPETTLEAELEKITPKNTKARNAWTVEQCLAEDDTFKAATCRKIGSRLAIKHWGNMNKLDDAVKEGISELRSIRLSTSKTCSDSRICESTVRRWLSWYFIPRTDKNGKQSGFDPAKVGKGTTQRDSEDKERYSYHRNVSISYILKCLSDLSFREKEVVSQFYNLQRKWNGRVATKVIYEDDGFCSKSEWFNALNKLGKRVTVLDSHSANDKKCRQWGFSQSLISMAQYLRSKETKERVVAAATEERERRKKEETVYGEQQQAPTAIRAFPEHTPPSLDFDSLVSTLDDHFSSDVYENQEPARNMI